MTPPMQPSRPDASMLSSTRNRPPFLEPRQDPSLQLFRSSHADLLVQDAAVPLSSTIIDISRNGKEVRRHILDEECHDFSDMPIENLMVLKPTLQSAEEPLKERSSHFAQISRVDSFPTRFWPSTSNLTKRFGTEMHSEVQPAGRTDSRKRLLLAGSVGILLLLNIYYPELAPHYILNVSAILPLQLQRYSVLETAKFNLLLVILWQVGSSNQSTSPFIIIPGCCCWFAVELFHVLL